MKNVYRIQIGTESLLLSLVRDVKTFSIILTCYWLNYQYIGGNNWLDFILTCMLFCFGLSKAFTTKENISSDVKLKICDNKQEAIDFINKN